MSRTIVVSDLHGRLAPLEAALEHAEFDPDLDQIVIAGDLIDVGTDDILERAEELDAIVLPGNHEVAAALGLRITPQNIESIEHGPDYAERMLSGEWPLAIAIEGWLISHAGLSITFSDIANPFAGDLPGLVGELNDRFVDEMSEALQSAPLEWESLERFRILGSPAGPLWFRPRLPEMVAWGINQVAGHTPPETLSEFEGHRLTSAGFLLVDPGGHAGRAHPKGPAFRYAVIEDAAATVVEG